MKVIIAGSRNITDFDFVKKAIEESSFDITEVVSGKAPGVDSLGEKWAGQFGAPVQSFPADWKQYGRAAGPIRNRQMAEYADALIAIPKKDSKGTADMIKVAMKKGLKIFVKEYQDV